MHAHHGARTCSGAEMCVRSRVGMYVQDCRSAKSVTILHIRTPAQVLVRKNVRAGAVEILATYSFDNWQSIYL